MSHACPHCGAYSDGGPAYGMTPRMYAALSFISGYITEHKFSPTFDEVMTALDLKSKSPAHRVLHGLEERNLIRMIPYCARTITLTDAGEAVVRTQERVAA